MFPMSIKIASTVTTAARQHGFIKDNLTSIGISLFASLRLAPFQNTYLVMVRLERALVPLAAPADKSAI
jgi:hypothetical protein